MQWIGMDRRSKLILIVSVLVIVGAVVMIFHETAGPPLPQLPKQAWFYDLNTGKLFTGPFDAIPPIPAPSGPLPDGTPAGVLAYVFGSNDCAESDRTIAYLETRTSEAQRKLNAIRQLPRGSTLPPELANTPPNAGILVSRPGDAQWFESHTTEAVAVTHAPEFSPRERKFHPCFPSDR